MFFLSFITSFLTLDLFILTSTDNNGPLSFSKKLNGFILALLLIFYKFSPLGMLRIKIIIILLIDLSLSFDMLLMCSS